MIDYLDLLLTGEWEEEEDAPFVWKRQRVGWPAKGNGSEQESMGPEKKSGLQGQPRQTPSLRMDLEPGQVEQVAADLERQLAQLERMTARGQAQALHSDTPRQRIDVGAVMSEADGRSSRKRGTQEVNGERRLAEKLDVAFERDARRYDGPMGLY